MGIIKWLNSHAIPATIFYFALMGGIAWGVNQSIADRTASTDIEGVDLLAIYDDSEAAGRSISVTNFRGDNLNAIVNAEAGVTDPQITIYDNNDGATGTAAIYGQSVDGTKAIVMSIGVEKETTGNASYIELDGINQTVDVLKPLDSVPKFISTSSSFSLDTSYGSVCNLDVTMTGNPNELTLWADSECGTLGIGKRVHILYRGAGTLTITPGSGDILLMNVAGYTVAADESIATTAAGAYIELRGRDGGAYWDVINISTIPPAVYAVGASQHWPDPSP